MNILQINSSARSTGSASTRLADAITARVQAANPGATLARREEEWRGERPREDDLTLVLLRREP